MATGSCLCGRVGFEIDPPFTRIELCHCRRCRTAYGTGFAATIYAQARGFRWTCGRESVVTFEAPVRERPPGYRHVFCASCGSPLPIAHAERGVVEVPIGAFVPPVECRPAHHIFACHKLSWVDALATTQSFAGAAPAEHSVIGDLQIARA